MKSTVKNRRISLLAAILTVILLRPLPGLAASADSTETELERFFDSDYTWCDVQLLAAHWEQDWMEAKARIGRKIGWGDEPVIEEFLVSARSEASERGERCSFYDSEFSFEDAELLAAVWDMPIDEAKTRVEDKLFYGGANIVRSTLAEARENREQPGQNDPLAVFWASGYTYCDARLVAASWQEEVFETKQRLGEKILAGNLESVDWNLEEARGQVNGGALQGFTCDYSDEGYTYDDMVALAGSWQMSIEETKATVEQKLLSGLNREIQDSLGQPQG